MHTLSATAASLSATAASLSATAASLSATAASLTVQDCIAYLARLLPTALHALLLQSHRARKKKFYTATLQP